MEAVTETANVGGSWTQAWIKLQSGTELRNQQSAFCVLMLFVLALLLVLHTLFASILGQPSTSLIVLLAVGFAAKVAELIRLQTIGHEITGRFARVWAAGSTVATFVLTGFLAYLMNRDESPYFVLLAIPILQCAHLFGLLVTTCVIFAADATIVFWLWHFFHLHPPARPTEYLEAGMISIIYMVMGFLVWFLVNLLRLNQVRLTASLTDLETARERLVSEEKLAAVGRLASGIAHEIRNPVSMISSALSTAAVPTTPEPERQEMFAVAARESARLERLTADFLVYARPAPLRYAETSLLDLLTYVGDVGTMHAENRPIEIIADAPENLTAVLDNSLIEAALLNLVLNAIDAIPEAGSIHLRSTRFGQMIHIDVENSGPAISPEHLGHVFEPFFTTKATGTGLGLAIARGIATAHGGDLWVSNNVNGSVTFTLAVPAIPPEDLPKD